MILKGLKYTRFANDHRKWDIIGNSDDYAYFDKLNLIVGKNASGKSRTLTVIKELADILSGEINMEQICFPLVSYDVLFVDDDGNNYKYMLESDKKGAIKEVLTQNGEIVFTRENNCILNSKTNKKETIDNIKLEITTIDSKGNYKYPKFIKWANSVRCYMFSDQIEKRRYVKDYTIIDKKQHQIENLASLVHIFYRGIDYFGKKFVSDIKNSMHEIGYEQISNIEIQKTSEGYGLSVQEDGHYVVSQKEMSQGMYRALAFFILITYARNSNESFCVLVDDIGEGLDFERSKALIDILVKKMNNSNNQYFFTTNDRYIMNHIPLRFWTVIDPTTNKSIYYDYVNSKENFEDFKYTGLNNFDFLTTDFYKKGFGDLEA